MEACNFEYQQIPASLAPSMLVCGEGGWSEAVPWHCCRSPMVDVVQVAG